LGKREIPLTLTLSLKGRGNNKKTVRNKPFTLNYSLKGRGKEKGKI